MYRETGTTFNPDSETGSEEEVDVEALIAKNEADLADFISSDNEDRFNVIFDAVRLSDFSKPDTAREWSDLFTDFDSALTAADGEDEVETIISNYIKKAEALVK